MTTNRESKRIPQTLAELAAQTGEILAELEAEDRAVAKQPRKRILSVTVKRDVDDSPDTSYYGGYASERTSEFSIDRAHSDDCRVNNDDSGIEQLERVIEYLVHQSQYASKADDHAWYEVCDESANLLIGLQDELRECDCDERGDMGRGEYRYFNPSLNYVDKRGQLIDGNAAEDVRKYVRQDYDRMESLNRSAWCFLGVSAEARVQLDGDLVQTITSGGLWGIESDSGDYFTEVETEQLDELRSQLHAVGFTKRAVSAAFRNVQHANE